jgi:PAS domain S-box-containing protein
MSGAYVYTPAIWPPLIAAAFLAVIAQYVWRRRDVPGGKPFVAISVLTILVLLAIALEAAAIAPAAKIGWYKLQFVLLFAAVTPVTCFVLDYAYPGRWLTRRNLILLSIPPVICLLMVLINDSQLIWRRLEVGSGGSILVSYAPAGAILLAYAIGMALVYLAVFLWLFIRSPQHRWPVALMLLGQVSSRTVFLLDNAHLPALSGLDLTTFVVVLPWTTYAIAMFGFHILDPLPAARRTLIEEMHAGVVVFDAGWRAVSLNPAAERILGVAAGAARGETWQQLVASQTPLPALPDASPGRAGITTEDPDMTFGSGKDARHYAAALSPLHDFRGLLLGHLLMLHDVTEQKRAQTHLLEQRWAEATLQERAQLAQELHDGLSQNLGFLNLQAQAAQLYLETGQVEAAQAHVARLAEVAREMQGDTRELIGSLLAVVLPSQGLCATLRQIASDYQRQYGLAVRLELDAAAEALCGPTGLPAAVGVQLVRIVQEALANVRKHAGSPDRIDIELRAGAGLVQLVIADNGAGFDPHSPGIGAGHFGFQVMRQRAASVGGQLAVHSTPGQGSRVEVCVPLASDEAGVQHEDTAR